MIDISKKDKKMSVVEKVLRKDAPMKGNILKEQSSGISAR